jgi:hypothetical protein
MADIQKDSYSETNNFTKVIFQIGKEVQDYELNELQDNIRISNQRGISAIASDGSRSAGSSDDGLLCVGTSDTGVTLKAGTVLFGGIFYRVASDIHLTLNANNHGTLPRRILLYARVMEQEVTDPFFNNDLGETTRRKQLEVTFHLSYGTSSSSPTVPSLPNNTLLDIWAGGARYFAIADIHQYGSNSGTTVLCYDRRTVLSPRIVGQIVKNWPFPTSQNVRKIEGVWVITCGDGVHTYGDFNGSTAVEDAMEWIWAKLSNNPSGEPYSFRINVKTGTYLLRNFRNTGATTPTPGMINRIWDLHIVGEGGHARGTDGFSLDAYGTNGTRLVIPSNTTATLGSPGTDRTNVRFENLAFNSSLATNVVGTLDLRGAKTVLCSGVVFDGVVVRTETRGRLFKFTDCTFKKGPETVSSNALFHIHMGQGKLDSIIFDACLVESLDTTAPANFINVIPESTGWSNLYLLKLDNCSISLAGSTGSANSGRHDSQRGVFRVSTTSSNVNCFIDEIVMNDCRVSSLTSASATAYGTCLVDWHGGGGNSGPTFDQRNVHVGKFTVRGGFYHMNVGQGQKFPAFRIQGHDAFGTEKAGHVILDGVRLKIDVVGNNAKYADVKQQGANDTSVRYNGGLFYLSGNSVIMNNVVVDGYVIQSGSGDIALRASSLMSIQGLRMIGPSVTDAPHITGGDSLPAVRIHLNGQYCENVVVRDVVLSGSRRVDASNDLGGVIQLPSKAGSCLIDNVTWASAELNDSPFFYFRPEGGVSATISNCQIKVPSQAHYGKAFRIRVSDSAGTISICNNVFYGCWGDLYIDEDKSVDSVIIDKNTFAIGTGNIAQSNAPAALRIYQRNTYLTMRGQVSVTNNTFNTRFGQLGVIWGENSYDYNIGVFLGNGGMTTPTPSPGQSVISSPPIAVFRPNVGRIRGVEVVGASSLNAQDITMAQGTVNMAFNNMRLRKE